MPARMPQGLGLLGPVNDGDAMAANVAAPWRGDHRMMGRAARARRCAVQLDSDVQKLFGEI